MLQHPVAQRQNNQGLRLGHIGNVAAVPKVGVWLDLWTRVISSGHVPRVISRWCYRVTAAICG